MKSIVMYAFSVVKNFSSDLTRLHFEYYWDNKVWVNGHHQECV